MLEHPSRPHYQPVLRVEVSVRRSTCNGREMFKAVVFKSVANKFYFIGTVELEEEFL